MFLPLVDLFGDDEVTQLFSEESIVGAWLEVERALAHAQAELGIIPAEAAAAIDAAAAPGRIDLARLRERTLVVGYPILPLLEQIGACLARGGPLRPLGSDDAGHHGHRPCARPRVARSIASRPSSKHSVTEVATKADTHRATVMPGRTHAQPAVPITFGGKLAVWLAELTRHLDRLRAVRRRVAVVQLFGAAGTAAALGPQSRAVRHGLAERLGLGAVDVPWHTARDGLAEAGLRARRDGGHLRQARARGRRALRPGDRRGARGGRPPPRRLVDDAAEGEPDRQRGGRRAQRPGRPARRRPARRDAGNARARRRRVAGGVGRVPAHLRRRRGCRLRAHGG